MVGGIDLGDLGRTLIASLADSAVAICLCDSDDHIRYVNEAFRRTLSPSLLPAPTSLIDALATEIRQGGGIALKNVTLEEFIPRAKERRRTYEGSYTFSLDLSDGTWWLINEHKLANGWILVLATDISRLKTQEFKLREDHAEALKAAQTDHLTGLANRRHGLERASRLRSTGGLACRCRSP